MTFKELKDALGELKDEQLAMEVELRSEEIIPIVVALTFHGVPFFCYGSTDDGQS